MSAMSDEQQKVAKQIEKLLALSKSKNENEAALALAKAEELLEKYRLDITLIEMMGGDKEQIIEDEDPLFDSENITLWESKLSNGIAQMNGCTTLRYGNKMIRVIGRPSDIMFVRYFVTYITLELFRISTPMPEFYRKRKDYKDSWFMGAVEVILQRIHEAKQETQQSFATASEQNKFAVATVNNRLKETMDKLAEIHPNLTYGNPEQPKRFNTDAYYSGRAAGHSIKLKQDKVVSNTPKPTIT